ncbi:MULTISPECIES: CIA30 family protein [Trichocoleus]|uniref:CIA30 family protein n=1 Tax=Trichocoleus desertorum GB2-A4 TaxID=2933944 RepID=A0ABV0JDK5_9CYAN|nr:CIA30 family protein [Trichocoleus sp. FACHB-46]MBD1861274.1 CIA30 family protein [Trichocoleus sp. FACHB-46]
MAPRNSTSWDAGRFLKTLAYFDVIPFFSCLQRLFKGQPQHPINSPTGAKRMGVVLVAGATSALGQQVVQRLLAQGYQVRSLVPDLQRGQAMGTQADLLVANLTQTETLTPEALGNIDAIVYYSAAVPSASTNASYSTASLSTQNLVQAAAPVLSQPGETTFFDFTYPSTSLKELWGAVDDVVMGGVSQSEVHLSDSSALFVGNVSTANSGGFASIRTRNFSSAIALGNYQGIKLRVKGDGNRYKFLLRTEEKWDGVAYSHSFDTVSDQWMDIEIPFSALVPVFRAKTVPNDGPIDPNRICSCQFMLSKFEYDGALNPQFTPGPFQLEIASVKAYGGPTLPQFVLLSVATSLQLQSDSTSLSQDEERVRSSGIPHTIIRLYQSTKLTGDRSQETVNPKDIAELCVQVLAQPEACNRTFEKAVN